MSNPHPVHMVVLGGHLSSRCCASLWGSALDKQDAAGPQLMPVHHDSKHRVACLPMLLVVSHKCLTKHHVFGVGVFCRWLGAGGW